MIFTFYEMKCNLCFKKFEAPVLPFENGWTNLYYNKQSNTYSYFTWNGESKPCLIVKDFLKTHSALHILNDTSRGRTENVFIGIMADGGRWKLIQDNKHYCPRCGFRFIKNTNIKSLSKPLRELTFNKAIVGGKIYLEELLKNKK